MYFFRSNIMYFAQKEIIKVQRFETFEFWGQNSPKFCHFWKKKSVFLQILHHSSVSWDIIPPYFVVEILYTFNKSSLSKTNLVKFHVSMRKSEILHFDGLVCLTHIKFKLKKYRRFVSHSSEEWCKISRKKNWFVVSNTTWGIWWIFRQPVKSLKISLLWALFVQSKWGLC